MTGWWHRKRLKYWMKAREDWNKGNRYEKRSTINIMINHHKDKLTWPTRFS